MSTTVEDFGLRDQIRTNGNTTIVVAGNNTTSQIAKPGETVISASISQLMWTTDAAVTISRGANTLFVLPPGTDHWNLRASGFTINEYPAANLVITTAATANCTVIVELTKKV